MTEKDRNEEIFTIKESGILYLIKTIIYGSVNKKMISNNIYELLEKIKIDRDGSQKKVNLNLQVQALQEKLMK